MASAIGGRLQKWGLERYKNLTAFAEGLGMSPQNLNAYLRGYRIPGNTLKGRLRELGCDIGWLMTGQSERLQPELFEVAQYPIVSHIRAGGGTVAEEPRIEYTRTAAGPAGPKYRGALFFEVRGDSMEPRWEEGDLVLVHPKVRPKNGEYGIVCWDKEDGSLKKLFYQKGAIVLQSINPSYQAIVVDPKAVWFIGKVLLTKHKD